MGRQVTVRARWAKPAPAGKHFRGQPAGQSVALCHLARTCLPMLAFDVATLDEFLQSASTGERIRHAVASAAGSANGTLVSTPVKAWYVEVADTAVVWLASDTALIRVEVSSEAVLTIGFGMSRIKRVVTTTTYEGVNGFIEADVEKTVLVPGAEGSGIVSTMLSTTYPFKAATGSAFLPHLQHFLAFLRMHVA